MDIKITPSRLKGRLTVPSSKSISHRALICAALCDGTSVIKNTLECDDTEATINALTALGATIAVNGAEITVNGIKNAPQNAEIDCNESGSTLRFIMPIAAAFGVNASFSGKGKLPSRPITEYFTELSKNGIIFTAKEMPYKIEGRLMGGEYRIAGNVSSQFITGLLFALPLLNGDSKIILTSPLESKPYVDITIACLNSFGVAVEETEYGYFVKGNQRYHATDYSVEADYSNAAFFLVANALGSDVILENLNEKSVQGDAEIMNVVNSYNGKAFDISASQIPDLVPVLTVLASLSVGTSTIFNAERLRIKECDRLAAITDVLSTLGAKIHEYNDKLVVEGVDMLQGGTCDSYNDHRIPMSIAVAATRATQPIIIKNAECVSKSYPQFWEDYKKMGGIVDVVNA